MNGVSPLPRRVLDDATLDLLELTLSGWSPLTDLCDAIGPEDAVLCDAEGTPIAELSGSALTPLAPLARGITTQWDSTLRRRAVDVLTEVGAGAEVVFVHRPLDHDEWFARSSSVVFVVCTPRASRGLLPTTTSTLIEETRAVVEKLRRGGATRAYVVVAPIDPRSTPRIEAAARALHGTPVIQAFDPHAHADPLKQEHRGAVVLFTGLSGSGKSTLARALVEILDERGFQTDLLDGDAFRRRHSPTLGFDRESRIKNLASLGTIARASAEAGNIAVAAPIAPFEAARLAARSVVGTSIPFMLVYVSTPLEVCEARDRKGLYLRARRGEIEHFTGISSPFEPPVDPDLAVDTSNVAVPEAVDAIVKSLLPRVQGITDLTA